jgi:small basic protein
MKGWLILFVLLVGIALGVSAALLGPDFIDPYLPQALRREAVTVEGSVVEKQRKDSELLLTINTPQGAILATVKKKVTEVQLLVDKGDIVELVLRKYEPFVMDPKIKRVRKGEARPMPEEALTPQPPAEKPLVEETAPSAKEKVQTRMKLQAPVEEKAVIENAPGAEEKQPPEPLSR